MRGLELIGRRRMLQKALKKGGPVLRFSERAANTNTFLADPNKTHPSQQRISRGAAPLSGGLCPLLRRAAARNTTNECSRIASREEMPTLKSLSKWVAIAFAIAIGLVGFMAVLSPPAKPITLPQRKHGAGTMPMLAPLYAVGTAISEPAQHKVGKKVD